MVGKGLTVNPPPGLGQRLIITPGSAGLGVPRGTVRNLDRVSREVTKHSSPVEVATEPRGHIAPPSHSTNGNLNSTSSVAPSSANQPAQVSAPHTAPPPAAPRMPPAPVHSSKPH